MDLGLPVEEVSNTNHMITFLNEQQLSSSLRMPVLPVDRVARARFLFFFGGGLHMSACRYSDIRYRHVVWRRVVCVSWHNFNNKLCEIK